jgi:very-short-patch-repair endonuclease
VQQPVAGRGDEGPRGPQPVGAALGAAMVELLAKSDPDARRLLGRVERPLARLWLAAWLPDAPDGTRVEPNCKIGPYRVDFLVLPRVVVEIDGEGPVRASSDQVVRERRRDRYLVAQGYAVLRFAGDEVHTNPWRCAAEVRDYLLGRPVAGLEGA